METMKTAIISQLSLELILILEQSQCSVIMTLLG